ncbi:MAG TPA: hypothetical protein VKK31_23425 [Thermoanaerobaculia bacterium]|nr:hypothetical protein [Thermoanaerobaculia bacterium]
MDQDLIAYLDQRFSEMDQRFDKVDQRFSEMDQRLDRVETEVRHAHVAIEDLRDKVQLTAEGIASGNEQLKQHQADIAQRFHNLESLNRLSYQNLDLSHQNLDFRVRKLEAAG